MNPDLVRDTRIQVTECIVRLRDHEDEDLRDALIGLVQAQASLIHWESERLLAEIQSS